MREHYPPVETDPLGAIRKELLAAGWRRKARRDRRRRATTALSTFLLTLVCAVGGAAALGLNVPVIDDVLERFGADRQEIAQSPDREPTTPIAPADIKPGLGNSTESLEIPWGQGAESAYATAYLNTNDQACFVLLRPGDRVQVGGCIAPELVSRRLGDAAVYLVGVRADDDATLVTGYVAADVERVSVDGPHGQLPARLSEPWQPDAPGAEPLRALVASSAPPRGDKVEDDEILSLDNYRVSARLRDGRIVTVHR